MTQKQKAMLQEVAAKIVEHSKQFHWAAFTTEYPEWDETVPPGRECGTMHCVVGWLPVWFPDDWTTARLSNIPILRHGSSLTPSDDFASYFGVTDDEAVAIIYPDCQHYIKLPNLGDDATAQQVADIINNVISRYPEAE